MKAIPNRATGASPIPCYMHPDTARRLLRLSQLLNAGRRYARELAQASQRRMEGEQ